MLSKHHHDEVDLHLYHLQDSMAILADHNSQIFLATVPQQSKYRVKYDLRKNIPWEKHQKRHFAQLGLHQCYIVSPIVRFLFSLRGSITFLEVAI